MQQILHTRKWIFYLIIAVLIYPYLNACKFLVPASDDFSYAWRAALYYEKYHNSIFTAIKLTQNEYMNMQGTYWGSFLTFFLVQSGFKHNFLLIRLLSFICILLVMILLFEVLLKIFEICGMPYKEKMSLGILAATFFTGMNMVSPSENFYWLNGMCFFTIPLIITLCGSVFLVNAFRSRKWMIIPAVIFGVLAAGGSLMIAAILNEMYLGISLIASVYYCKDRGRYEFKWIIPYIIVFLSTIINVIAPGNWIRHEAGTGTDEINLMQTIYNTVYVMSIRMGELLFHSYFILFCFILVVVIAMFDFDIKIKFNYMWGWLVEFFSIFIVLFPVLLGYGGTGTPTRVSSIIYSLFSIETYLNIVYTVCYIKKMHKGCREYLLKKRNKRTIFLALFLILLINTRMLWMRTYIEFPYFVAVDEQVNGNLKKFSEKEMQVLYTIQNSSDRDVVITEEIPYVKTLKKLELSRDCSYWVNSAVSKYYKKDTVTYR